MNKLLLIVTILFSINCFSQELNCNVVINASQTGNENLQVFKTLENQINEFINNTTWTNKNYNNKQRINCSMIVNISSFDNNNYKATLQIQSSRPIFNSSYNSTLYNYIDKNFSFQYQEFQNFTFNSDQFESNLVSVLAFHVYIILGLDADTFKLNSGNQYYQRAQKILDYSNGTNYLGWSAKDGRQTRYYLIDNLLSPTYKEFSQMLYNYHLNGLDKMYDDIKGSKSNIAKSILSLERMNNRRPNSYLLKVFFDSKADEIKDIFSGGPSVEITNLLSTLTKLAPIHSSKWREIKF